MAANPLNPHLPRPALTPGQQVYVNYLGALWCHGTVVSVAHTAIGVALATSQGTARRTVAPWLVRPVDALAPRAAADLQPGDQIAGPDGTRRTIAAAPWRCGTAWVLTFAGGTTATVPDGAVLPVADPDPEAPPLRIHLPATALLWP